MRGNTRNECGPSAGRARATTHRLTTTTTIGDLISELFTAYERSYQDRELAAVATQLALNKLTPTRRREKTTLDITATPLRIAA